MRSHSAKSGSAPLGMALANLRVGVKVRAHVAQSDKKGYRYFMKIHGLQKMTLLDFPGKVACTVFLGGCDFACPFCHNADLLDMSAPAVM